MSEVKIYSDTAQLAQGAANEIKRIAQSAVSQSQRFTIALSGGSTPKTLYGLLAEETWRAQIPWQQTHVFWGDERHVSPSHLDSNFRMANEALLSKLGLPPGNIHRITGELADPASAAHEYEQELKNFFNLSANQAPRFDLILLGIGADGHTASLFPGTAGLREREHLCVANWVEQLSTWRITLTLPVLNNAANVMFLVTGADKAHIVHSIVEGEERELYPAQLVQPTSGNLLWLLDSTAASR
ncbi:MAG TPA: 6-phosphogluconolactonase [Pyrinomonadaceae bacterium]|nr:6-phosphogluconolactonase [Pyrinomonadaceae bacterium]